MMTEATKNNGVVAGDYGTSPTTAKGDLLDWVKDRVNTYPVSRKYI